MKTETHAPILTAETFETEVVRSGRPAAVDFTAAWCAPCRTLAPHVDALAAEANVYKVDVEATPEIAERYGVFALPTVLVFRDGVEARRLVGPSPARFAREVREALAG
jgi:thioredoxin 1